MNAAGAKAYAWWLFGLVALLALSESIRELMLRPPLVGPFGEAISQVILTGSDHRFILMALCWSLCLLMWQRVVGLRRKRKAIGPSQNTLCRDASRIALVGLAILADAQNWAWGPAGGMDAMLADLRLGIDQSTNALVLVTGLACSFLFDNACEVPGIPASEFADTAIAPMTIFLAATSCLHIAGPYVYHYRGATRWSGLWVNPNTFGLFMGSGAILGLGRAIVVTRRQPRPRAGTDAWRRVAIVSVLSAAVCGLGLLKSYSRGAWLGTACGLAYLGWRSLQVRYRRSALLVLAALIALVPVVYWKYRYSDSILARRLFSVGNPNDFSSRNRIRAWSDCSQILLAQPWRGVGWGRVEAVFEESFPQSQPSESLTLQLNDYLTVACSAGIPALLCLLAYLGLTLGPGLRGSTEVSLAVVCQSASILFLVAFWFDGGLFKLAPAALFWFVMEFSRSNIEDASKAPSPSVVIGIGRYSDMVIRAFLAVSVLASAADSALHIGVPRLAVTPKTLDIAKRYLVAPWDLQDLNYLASQPIKAGTSIGDILDDAELSNYNRTLVNWRLSDSLYRQFVLSPAIPANPLADLPRRRSLWENFYPWIRKENSPAAAAAIVLRRLRRSETVPALQAKSETSGGLGVSNGADRRSFGYLLVASLRSVGIPARFAGSEEVEIWSEGVWQPIGLLER